MPVRRAVRLLAHKKRTLRERYYYYTIPVPGSQEAFGAKLAAEMRLQPAGKRNRLSHRLCPPGPPGRRSRAAQALVAPAGAKLPRTLSLKRSLSQRTVHQAPGRGFGQRRLGEDGGYCGFSPSWRGSANRGRSQRKPLSPQNSPPRAAGAGGGRILGPPA